MKGDGDEGKKPNPGHRRRGSWKQYAGREHGNTGYVFGDLLLRPAAKQLSKLMATNSPRKKVLHQAAEARDIIRVKTLLKEEGCLVDEPLADGLPPHYDATTPLMRACALGYADIAAVLIAHDADMNMTDNKGLSALDHAHDGGFLDVVQMLLKHDGHRLRLVNSDLIRATSAGDVPKILSALQQGAHINYKDLATGQTALMMASHCGLQEVVKLLLLRGASVRELASPLKMEKVDHVDVANGGSDFTGEDTEDHIDALSLASLQGHATTVDLLLCHGYDAHSSQALKVAAEKVAAVQALKEEDGHTDVAQSLRHVSSQCSQSSTISYPHNA
jgi:ankyrin repeat protein